MCVSRGSLASNKDRRPQSRRTCVLHAKARHAMLRARFRSKMWRACLRWACVVRSSDRSSTVRVRGRGRASGAHSSVSRERDGWRPRARRWHSEYLLRSLLADSSRNDEQGTYCASGAEVETTLAAESVAVQRLRLGSSFRHPGGRAHRPPRVLGLRDGLGLNQRHCRRRAARAHAVLDERARQRARARHHGAPQLRGTSILYAQIERKHISLLLGTQTMRLLFSNVRTPDTGAFLSLAEVARGLSCWWWGTGRRAQALLRGGAQAEQANQPGRHRRRT